jgi:hypothetical protein
MCLLARTVSILRPRDAECLWNPIILAPPRSQGSSTAKEAGLGIAPNLRDHPRLGKELASCIKPCVGTQHRRAKSSPPPRGDGQNLLAKHEQQASASV